MKNEKSDGAALKALREARAPAVERAKERIRLQSECIRKIRAALGDGPKTVPEIAAAAGLSSAETLRLVAGLRKYGELREADPREGYYTYDIVAK